VARLARVLNRSQLEYFDFVTPQRCTADDAAIAKMKRAPSPRLTPDFFLAYFPRAARSCP